MSRGSFTWCGEAVAFRPGDSIAMALIRAGARDLGVDGAGCQLRYFCGIGACQNCLVDIDGATVEACLTPAAEGLTVETLEASRG